MVGGENMNNEMKEVWTVLEFEEIRVNDKTMYSAGFAYDGTSTAS